MSSRLRKSSRVAGIIAAIGVAATALANITTIIDWFSTEDGGSRTGAATTADVAGQGNQVMLASSHFHGNNNSITQHFEAARSAPSVDPQASKLLGAWDTQYRIGADQLRGQVWKGLMTFLPNGQYTFFGECEVRDHASTPAIDYTMAVAATGQWSVSGDRLMVQHIDVKSNPVRLLVNGQQTSFSSEIPLPKLEDAMPAGNASQYTIKSLDTMRMRSEARDAQGRFFEVVGIRRQ